MAEKKQDSENVVNGENSPKMCLGRTFSRLFRSTFNRLFLLGIIVVVIGAYFGVSYYGDHQSRHLREAEARLNIDDRLGAIECLRQHIVRSPDDISSRVWLGDLLCETGQRVAAMRVYKRAAIAEAQKSVPALGTAVLNVLYGDSATVIYDAADSLLADSELQAAASLLDSIIHLYEEHPFISRSSLYVDSVGFLPWFCNFEIESLSEAIARKAMVSWLIDHDISDAIGTLNRGLWRIPQVREREDPEDVAFDRSMSGYSGERDHFKGRCARLKHLLSTYASEKFDASQYKEAIAAWQSAIIVLTEIGDSVVDPAMPSYQYNIALCLFNQGKHIEAAKRLREIRSTHPNWKIEMVKRMIENCERSALFAIADKAWDEKRWIDVVEAYDACIKFLLRTDRDECNELVSECRYNMGNAYANNGQYKEALDIFVSLQQTCPEFEPLLVSEAIRKYKLLL